MNSCIYGNIRFSGNGEDLWKSGKTRNGENGDLLKNSRIREFHCFGIYWEFCLFGSKWKMVIFGILGKIGKFGKICTFWCEMGKSQNSANSGKMWKTQDTCLILIHKMKNPLEFDLYGLIVLIIFIHIWLYCSLCSYWYYICWFSISYE